MLEKSPQKLRWIGSAVLTLGLLALSTSAYARPEQVPEPVERPADKQSPATGQAEPEDPEAPPAIEAPTGLDCVAGEDQGTCDPDHQGNAEGERPGNTPPEAWYDQMAKQMQTLQEGLESLAAWAGDNDPQITYYATWLNSVVGQVQALAYDGGRPREYPYGQMTRGDFNYYYYYWLRPIYTSLLDASAKYYDEQQGSDEIARYEELLGEVSASFTGLVSTNYGLTSVDTDAREDLLIQTAEERAGLDD